MRDGGQRMSVDPVDSRAGDRSDRELQEADAERYAKLMRAIAWLDTLRKTAIPDVVAAQRSRLIEELRHVALRRQRMVDTHVDVTERKHLGKHKNLLIRELEHRFKNMLSVISVIASRTQETTNSMAAFVTALDGRIKALMMAHELLSRRNWHGISLVDLVRWHPTPLPVTRRSRVQMIS